MLNVNALKTMNTTVKKLRDEFNNLSIKLDADIEKKNYWNILLENARMSVIYTKVEKEFRIYRKNHVDESYVVLHFGPDAISEITKYVQRTYSSDYYLNAWNSEGEIEIGVSWSQNSHRTDSISKLKWDITCDGLYFKISDARFGTFSGFFTTEQIRRKHVRIINILLGI